MSLSRCKEFFSILSYCFRVSWQASRLFTIFRLILRTALPGLVIVTTYAGKVILDSLAAARYNPVDWDVIFLWIIITFASTVVSLYGNRFLGYIERQHAILIENYSLKGLLEKSLDAKISLYDNRDFYDRFSIVKQDMMSLTRMLWTALDFVADVVSGIGVLALLISYQWHYAALLVVTVLPSAISTNRFTKSLYQLSVEQITDTRERNYLFEISSNKRYAQDIRLFNLTGMFKERFMKICSKLYVAQKRILKNQLSVELVLMIFPQIVKVFICVHLAYLVVNGQGTVGDYSYVLGLADQATGKLESWVMNFGLLLENKLKLAKVKNFDIPLDNTKEGGLELTHISTIEFKNVYFIYPGCTDYVIRAFNLRIESGEKVAIVGKNGSGKSTLLKLLLRFYEPCTGEIEINGINICKYSLDSLRNAFSCYFQDSPNYAFTIRENISLSSGEETGIDERIYESIRLGHAEGIVDKTTAGLDTFISRYFDNAGIELSGGEHQRLALSRCFYREAAAYIFDEPSSALDPETEQQILRNMTKVSRDKVSLFITHRMTNTLLADKVAIVEQGEVVELGPPEELLSRDGKLAEFFRYQRLIS